MAQPITEKEAQRIFALVDVCVLSCGVHEPEKIEAAQSELQAWLDGLPDRVHLTTSIVVENARGGLAMPFLKDWCSCKAVG